MESNTEKLLDIKGEIEKAAELMTAIKNVEFKELGVDPVSKMSIKLEMCNAIDACNRAYNILNEHTPF